MVLLHILVSFPLNGSGAGPVASVIEDAAGDLFGTAGGGIGYGAVFDEEAASSGYSGSPSILVAFNGTNGSNPDGSLIEDADGDLFGTTTEGGSSADQDGSGGYGTVFEIIKTGEGGTGYAATPKTLLSFNESNGANPSSSLVVDSRGNLFGSTKYGGHSGDGTVFEIAKTPMGFSNELTTLLSFNGSDGADPDAALLEDADGNLLGTTEYGGKSGDGTVFEIAKTSTGYNSTPITLVSFNESNGANPVASLTADADGNLFGTTENGGLHNRFGTVFEISRTETGYSSTLTTLVSFNRSDGANPTAGVILDAAGNVFGTTEFGTGSGIGDGSVFKIDKTGTEYSSTATTLVSFNLYNGALPVASLHVDRSGDLFGTTVAGGANGSGTIFEVTGSPFVPIPCFCSGTLILTECGEVAVEDLAIGTHVITASGKARPVQWIGHRDLDIANYPDPKTVCPIQVRAGAFAQGLPARDLWMSPGHCVFMENILIPIRALINDATVVQVAVERVTYWHVELDSHDILVAEGLQAESYFDTGNRCAFVNSGNMPTARLDLGSERADCKFASVRTTGPEVARVRRKLLLRAATFGHQLTKDPSLHLVADGLVIMAERLGDLRYEFQVPEGIDAVHLVSLSSVPAKIEPESHDWRELGLFVQQLEADGTALSLAPLEEGWHQLEGSANFPRRWTNGAAVVPLPAKTRRLVVELNSKRRYWARQQATKNAFGTDLRCAHANKTRPDPSWPSAV